MEGGGAQLL